MNEDFRRAILGDQDIGDGGSIIPSLETIIVEDSLLKKVKVLNEIENLLVHADSVCVVDWKDDSLPTRIPSVFNEGNFMDHLKTMLSVVKSIIKREAGIHNLGLLKCFSTL